MSTITLLPLVIEGTEIADEVGCYVDRAAALEHVAEHGYVVYTAGKRTTAVAANYGKKDAPESPVLFLGGSEASPIWRKMRTVEVAVTQGS